MSLLAPPPVPPGADADALIREARRRARRRRIGYLAVALGLVAGALGVRQLVGASGTGSVVTHGAPATRAATAPQLRGTIVFASDRNKENPGELYVLTGTAAPRDISRSAAADVGGTVSPDGDRVAFWSDRSGSHENLYLVDPDGTQLVRVPGIAGPADNQLNTSPIVFTNGGAQLYTSYVVERLNRESRTYAYRVDVQRATAVLLPWCRGTPLPSPGGRLVACPTSGLDAHFMPLDETAVWRVGGAGRPTRVATIVGNPYAWTPDGRTLIVQRRDGLASVVPGTRTPAHLIYNGLPGSTLSPVKGSNAVRFVRTSGELLALPVAGSAPADPGPSSSTSTVSSTGRRAYVRGRSLVVTGPGGREPAVVQRYGPFSSESLAWFPDGNRLLVSVASNGCGAKGLFLASPNGGPATAVSHDPRDLEAPSWSRSGKRIVYSVTVTPVTCHSGGQAVDIETIGVSGKRRASVTNGGLSSSFNEDPSFSPDGTKIAFDHSTTGPTVALQVVPTTGGAPMRIAAGLGNPTWSPDGRRIIATGRSGIVSVLASGSGSPTVISTLPPAGEITCGYGGGVAMSADGKELALARAGGIWTRSLTGRAPWRLAIRMRCAGEPTFSLDGREIAFDAPPAGRASETDIFVANVDGSALRTISAAPYRQSVHPAWGSES